MATAPKAINFTDAELASLKASLLMSVDTFTRKAKDARNPEAIQKIFHTATKDANALIEKLATAS